MTDIRQEITEVVLRYASGIDTRDWALLRTCFTDDCVTDYGGVGAWKSGDEITEFMRQTHEPCGYTLHRISNVVASASGDRAATARSYVDAIIMMDDNTHGAHAVGFYEDEFVRADDGWKIARRRFTSVFLEMIESAGTL